MAHGQLRLVNSYVDEPAREFIKRSPVSQSSLSARRSHRFGKSKWEIYNESAFTVSRKFNVYFSTNSFLELEGKSENVRVNLVSLVTRCKFRVEILMVDETAARQRNICMQKQAEIDWTEYFTQHNRARQIKFVANFELTELAEAFVNCVTAHH